MKKKTIKFYFFNKKNHQIAFDLVFCLSKSFVKQKKKFDKIKKGLVVVKTRKQKKRFLLFTEYQNSLVKKFYFIQWQTIPRNLGYFFLNSKFNGNLNKLICIMLWFKFKKKYKEDLNKKITNYVNLGIISSHYVHFFLRKNLTYQNRSKYNSNVFNTLFLQKYTQTCNNTKNNYHMSIKSKIYWYTKTLAHKNYKTNENYDLFKSNWTDNLNTFSIHSCTKPIKNAIYINVSDYTFEDLKTTPALIKNLLRNINEHGNHNNFLLTNYTPEQHTLVNSNVNTTLIQNVNTNKNTNYRLFYEFYHLY